MAAKTENFWGEIQFEGLRAPVAMLREQAALLAPKTRNLIDARVETRVAAQFLVHSFLLVVPALSDYTYELFSVRHQVEPYPVEVLDRERGEYGPTLKLGSEEAFVQWLKQELSSEHTKRIISNLLAHVSR